MSEIQNQIEKLKTLQESCDVLTDVVENQLPALADKIDNIDLTPLENKVDEGVDTLSAKIDNIKLPEIDTTELAKQGENPEATNSKILEEVQNKLTPLDAVLTELNHGKQEMVDAIKSKGGNSNADKSLSEIAGDVRAISNVDKTFNNVEYFMAQYGLSMSPLQLIYKHFDTEYPTYVCYVVDAGTKINVTRSAYVMFTADGAIDNPEGEYIIPEWENRFGYFIFAYKSTAVTWENFGAYFIGMYGATTTLDNRTLTNFIGFQSDNCNLTLSASCFESRVCWLLDFGNSDVEINGNYIFRYSAIKYANFPQVKKASGSWIFNGCSIPIVNFENLEKTSVGTLRSESITKICLNNLQEIGTQGTFYLTKVKEFYLPSLLSAIGSECVAYCTSLERFIAPNATNIYGYGIFSSCPKLVDIECGEIATSTTWNQWNPVDVLADADLTIQLDKNIREHVAMKIKDLSGETAQTFTFHQNLRNIMSAETEAVFAAKNWNISPAKTV
jgi:hypothetical protein